MSGIIVPDWGRRELNKGYVWQQFFVCATQKVTKIAFTTCLRSSTQKMNEAMGRWEQTVMRYMKDRCNELGMHATKIVANCQDEPDSEKPLEAVIWNNLDLAFVWAIWAYIDGPIAEEAARPGQNFPLEGFWPGNVRMLGDIAEVIDAESMLSAERGT